MRVALDVTPALSGQTGVARYATELLAALQTHDVEVRAFAIGRGPGQVPSAVRRVPIPLRAVQQLWRRGLPPYAEHISGAADVVHSCDLVLPSSHRPLVATIHDVAAIDRPDLHPPRATRQAQRRLDGLHRAAVILPNSQSTAAALERYGVRGAQVVVVPIAGARLPRATPTEPPPAPYLLSVGEIAARKDYPTLLRALASEPARHLRLVIVGPVGYRGNEVVALMKRLGVSDRVTLAGRVSDSALAGLYAGATALCMPSLIEGFGMPLVEAMSVQLPIVASDIDVVREVAGDAAIRVPAGDVDGFAQALASVTEDGQLRARLAHAAHGRAEAFSWDRTVTATVAAYRVAMSCG